MSELIKNVLLNFCTKLHRLIKPKHPICKYLIYFIGIIGKNSCFKNSKHFTGKEQLLLKVRKIFPKVSFPSWLHPVKIWRQTVSG